MSVSVDPFVIPIPQKLLNDPELGPTFQYLWKFLYDLWQRTGGGTDAIYNVTYELNAEESRSTPEMYKLDASDKRNKAEYATQSTYSPDATKDLRKLQAMVATQQAQNTPDAIKEIRRLQAMVMTLQVQNTMLEKKLNKFIAEVNASA